MADAKKPAAKPAPSSGSNQIVFMVIVFVMVLFIIFPTVAMFFGYSGTVGVSTTGPDLGERISYAFNSFLEGLSFVSIFISFVIVLALAYAKMGYKEIMTAFNDHQKNSDELMQRGSKGSAGLAPLAPVAGHGLPGQEAVPQQAINPKWEQIERHIASPNQSEWRIAILEADILLYDMLTQMGYPGDSIGEMLKQADHSSFTTLDEAWKAHRIRNIIAHEGASYELSREEAERAIRLFRKVFEEFYFI